MPRVIPQPRGKYNARLGKGLTKRDPTRTGLLRKLFSKEIRRRFSRLFAETRRLIQDPVYNAFCPTGPGGGQDNSCSPSGGGSSRTVEIKNTLGRTIAKVDLENRPTPAALKRWLQVIRKSGDEDTAPLRGAVIGGEVYVWEAKVDNPKEALGYTGIFHQDVADALGKPRPMQSDKFDVGLKDGQPVVQVFSGLLGTNPLITKWVDEQGLVTNLASTQFNIEQQDLIDDIKHIQSLLDPDDVVELEEQPHITVRYGLHGQEADQVQQLYQNTLPIRVRLGGLSLFPAGGLTSLRGGPEYDVLKIDVESKGLSALHQRLGLLPNTSTHSTYRPHLTIAYLKPGTGIKYVGESGMEGTELTFDRLVFSNDEREHTILENAFCPTGPGGGQDNSCSPNALSKEGRDLYVGAYKSPGGKKYDVEVRKVDDETADILYLRARGQGTGSFADVVKEFAKDMKQLGFTKVTYSTALDDKTGGKARERLFKRLEKLVNNAIKVSLLQTDNARTKNQHVNRFMKDFEAKVKTTVKDRPWWVGFVDSGFQTGVGRAYDDKKKPLLLPVEERKAYQAGKRQFVKSTVRGTKDVRKDLYGKVEEDLDRITSQLGDKLRNYLIKAQEEGRKIRDAAAEILPKLEAEGLRRAENVAQFRTVQAHAEGQLAAFEDMGIDDIGVLVEWTTADAPCPMCSAMEGVVLRPEDAHGLIPRHPHCKCSFEPIDSEDVDEDDHIADRAGIRRAVKASIRQGARKGVKFSKALEDEEWRGAEMEVGGRLLFNITPELMEFSRFARNAFCPTGPGGGQGNSCSPNRGGSAPSEKIVKAAANFVYRWSWGGKQGPPKSLPNLATEKFLRQFAPTEPVKLYRFEREDHNISKRQMGDTYKVPLESWTHDKEMAEGIAESLSEDGPRYIVREKVFQPHEVYTDFTQFPKELQNVLKSKGGDSEMQEVLVWKFTKNQFCPTGKGGGVDPTCSPSSTTKSGEDLYSASRGKDKVWRLANGQPAPEHIQKLGIPPGWKDVEINPNPKGTTYAKGIDSKGRVQTKYSATKTAQQAAAKFGRTRELIQKRAQIYKEIERDAKDPELKEQAECLKLVMQTGMRPGSDKDTKADHKSYGATTLEGRHVLANKDGTVTLRVVTGKNKGREVEFPVNDKATASMLKSRAKEAGKTGRLFQTSAANLRDYSKTKDGGGFKTKDHRTALGTETALRAIKRMPTPKPTEYKDKVKAVATIVAKALGNTPPIALKSYIDPQVFASWNKGLKK